MIEHLLRGDAERGAALPPFVQSLAWVFAPVPFMHALKARFGDAFTLRFAGFPPLHITTRADEIRDLFAGDPEVMHAGPVNVILRPILGPNSLLLLDGKRHGDERKLMTAPFAADRMSTYSDAMTEIAREVISRWPRDRAFSFHEEMQEITLQIILRTVFGLASGPTFERLSEALKRLLAFGQKPWLMLLIGRDGEIRGERWHAHLGRLSPWGRFRETRREIDGILDEEIAKLRKHGAGDRSDVFAMLTSARDEHGEGLSDQSLRDEMITLLVAGHETTATALGWTMLELLRNPDVLVTLKAKLALGDTDYLDGVIRESLRLNPIVPMVGRMLQRATKVGAHMLPAGTIVAPSIFLTQRREDLWPAPEHFDPMRFVGTRVLPTSFFPFGGGIRRCIGAAFALYEMRVVLREVVERVTLRLDDGYTPKVERRGITFAPSAGLPVRRTA